jgi:glutathione synthase/RimK-type ligase-like ATP-grasp enzyme
VKKVLVLDGSSHDDISPSHYESLDNWKSLAQDKSYELRIAAVQHAALCVASGESRMLIDLIDDVRQFDLVIFRNASRFAALAAPICLYLAHHKVQYVNGMDGPGQYAGKIAQMFLFALNGLPVPDSLLVRNPTALQSYLPKFATGTDLIVKDNNALKGNRNYLVKAGADLKKFLEGRRENYIVQPYIPNDGDYRLLFAGYSRPPLIFKRTGEPGSHLNNTSQGGSAKLVTDFPPAALTTARRAAELFGREIAGVDIIFDEKGNHYVLEVNETPALTSGFLPEAKLKVVDSYISDKLEL